MIGYLKVEIPAYTGTNHKLFTFVEYTKDLPRLGIWMIEIDEELCKGCGIQPETLKYDDTYGRWA